MNWDELEASWKEFKMRQEELIELAARHGYKIEWDHRGWARLAGWDSNSAHMSPYFSPPSMLRKSLLPKGHPEAIK